jgi:hypothetical protein
MDVTPEQYEAAIPACCPYRTYVDHMNGLMLCWCLVKALEEGHAMDCSGCDIAVDPSTK